MQTIITNSFSLSGEGLSINYLAGGSARNVKCDPLATCQLFKTLWFIEDYDQSEPEPVILFSTIDVYPGYDGEPIEVTGYSGEQWSDFIKSFPLNEKIVAIILAYLEDKEHYKQLVANGGKVIAPLKATA